MSAVDRWWHRTVLRDKFAMSVYFIGGIFLLWYELSHVAAFNHSNWSTAYMIHLSLGIFFTINVYGNLLNVFLTDTTGKGIVFPTGQPPPGWHYCNLCTGNRPPRSHHCSECQACILKRDHHCWFAAACIGHANHRYFFALCVHMVAVAIYCNIYNWYFVWDVKGEISFLSILSFILPHLSGVMGNESWYSFGITVVSMTGFTLLGIFSWLLEIQVVQIINGQTRYERAKSITEYSGYGWRANFQEVLGRRMFLVLLCPWLPSSLPGDGMSCYSHSQKVS